MAETPTEKPFQQQLASLINRHSKENGSDTPDFMLAEYLADCLATWDKFVKAREKWYGRGHVTFGSGPAPLPYPFPLPDCGHGHVYPRADGIRARCGGPGMCGPCSIDAAEKSASEARAAASAATTPEPTE